MTKKELIYGNLDTSNPNFPTEKDRLVIVSRFIRYMKEYWREIDEKIGRFDVGEPMYAWYRYNTDCMYIIAVALSSRFYNPKISGVDTEELEAYLEKGLRIIAYSHISNSKFKTEALSGSTQGSYWGDNWMSTLLASHLAKTLFIAGDKISKEIKDMINKIIIYEANVFLDLEPPSGLLFDSKAEENSWNSALIAWASILYPDHPNARSWDKKAKEFAINVYSLYKDHFDCTWLEDRRVKDWISTVNIHPDYTLENHGSFHPNYQKCYQFYSSVIPAYFESGLNLPRHFLHHVPQVLSLLKQVTLWNGRMAYPAGQDWYDDRFIRETGALAEIYDDDDLRTQNRRMFLNYDLHQKLSMDGSTLAAIMPDRLFYGYVDFRFQKETSHMVNFLEASWVPKNLTKETTRLQQNTNGVFNHPYCEFIICRTPHMFASFSWRNLWQMPSGLIIPQNGDSFAGWSFKGPHEVHCPYAGSIKFGDEGKEVAKVDNHEEKIPKEEHFFSTYGIVERGISDDNRFSQESRLPKCSNWLVKQYLLFAVLPDLKTVLVNDYLTCLNDCEVTENLGLDYLVENDVFNGDHRTIYYGKQKTNVPGVSGAPREIITDSNWLNIDDRISFLSVQDYKFIYKDDANRSQDAWGVKNTDKVYIRGKEGRFSANYVLRDMTFLIVADSTHLGFQSRRPVVQKKMSDGVVSLDWIDTRDNEGSFLLNTTMKLKSIDWKRKRETIAPYSYVSC